MSNSRGRLKSYSEDKKYGFIIDDSGKTVFFHRNNLKNIKDESELVDGCVLVYSMLPTGKGYEAKDVSIDKEQLNVDRYRFPDSVYTSKQNKIKGWETIEESDWVVHGTSEDSPDDAKREMEENATSLGANALVHTRYYKYRSC